MALLFIDSFDHYIDSEDKYVDGSPTSVVPGRHGNGLGESARCALNPTSNKVIVGFAFKPQALNATLISILDYPSNSVCTVGHTSTGALNVAMPGSVVSGNVEIHTVNDIVRVNQWHYVEAELTIQTTFDGTFYYYELTAARLILDNIQVLSGTLGRYRNRTDPPSSVGWAAVTVGHPFHVIDDYYILDGSGPAPFNAPIGDIRIDVIRPNAPGALTQWTPVGVAAGQNWDANNDINPDDAATHVVASAAGLSDLYEMENVNTGNTIIAAQILSNARRTEEGIAQLVTLVRHGTTVYEYPIRTLSPTYFYRNREPIIAMPNGEPLTDTNINNMQVGFKRVL